MRYRHLAQMEGPDPENGTGRTMFPMLRRNGAGSSRPRVNRTSTQQSVDSDSDSFLEKKQKLFKCARNKDETKDKDPKLMEQLNSVLTSFSKEDDKKRLVQETDDRGNTALHYAVKAGNLEVCKQLHKNGADINARGQNKMRPLQFAARYGDEKRPEDVWKCMKWIIDKLKNNQMSERNRIGGEVKKGRRSAKSSEKEEVIDVREKDKYDFSLLHHAIQNTNWEETPVVAKKLLESGDFKVTDADKQGNTSLHLAAEFDKQERHKILDVFLQKDENKRFKINEKVLKECIEARNEQGKTPLHIACGVGNPDSVEQLLKATKELGVNVDVINSPDNDGQLPLHLAIESENLTMMTILMQEGVVVSTEAIQCAVRCVVRNDGTCILSHSFSCRTGNKDVYNKLMEFRQKVDEESILICITVIIISNLSGRSGFF